MNTTPGALPATALAAIWLFTWVNLRGLRSAGGVQSATTVIKLVPFVAVIGLAVWRIATSGGAALPPITETSFSLAGTTGAVGLTLFAMLGLESAAMPADAVENPGRNVPLATMVGTGLSAVVTVIATCSVALLLPFDVVSVSKAPVADFIASACGGTAGTLVAVAAVISCFGCLNGWLFLGGQLPVAMAKSGTLPPWFGRLNAAGAPAQSIILGAVVTSLLVLMAYTKLGAATYNFAALISAATNLVLYLFCVLSVMRFMRDGRVPRSAGLIVGAALAFAFVIWALYSSGKEPLIWGSVLIALGWPVYLMARKAAARASTT